MLITGTYIGAIDNNQFCQLLRMLVAGPKISQPIITTYAEALQFTIPNVDSGTFACDSLCPYSKTFVLGYLFLNNWMFHGCFTMPVLKTFQCSSWTDRLKLCWIQNKPTSKTTSVNWGKSFKIHFRTPPMAWAKVIKPNDVTWSLKRYQK